MNGLDSDFRKGNTTESNEGLLCVIIILNANIKYMFLRDMPRIEKQKVGVRRLQPIELVYLPKFNKLFRF